ncbi:hypothetical protein CROQUDRAFT_655012 [Cronartium quercuum f. sp. fusiforme G11]|uniref:Uncharacterized protein n=1 Tax=Cronartium quercuum f. sp. fusiforme G11 TaxID=708437 RepID=A0A9P6TE26_9BASI|nr:hypothetical protein CROQUDRAFT_655012 [Cronartium quercuum f. sp. fusiforme G11]
MSWLGYIILTVAHIEHPVAVPSYRIKVNFNSATALLDDPRTYPHLARHIEEKGKFVHFKTYIDKNE